MAFVLGAWICCGAAVAAARPVESARGKEIVPPSRRTSIGFLAGAGFFSASRIGASPAFGMSFSLGISRNLAVELAGSFLMAKTDYDPQTHSQGKLLAMPLQFSLIGRFPVGRKLTPFALAGGSYFINSFMLDGTVKDGWSAVGMSVSEKVNNALGVHFGAGVEYSLSRFLTVGIDVRYFLAKAKGSWSLKENASGLESSGTYSGVNLNALVGSMALKYVFK
jgi:outer membrane protein W